MEARRELGIPDDAIVAGFVGRITRDKGIVELVEAFLGVSKENPRLHMLLAGVTEDRDQPPEETLSQVASNPRIHSLGWVADTRPAMSAMDFFVLPTHREGLGTVLLEAAAMKVPVITTEEAGWWGALVRGEDALIVPLADVSALRAAIERIAGDAALRHQLADAAYEKVVQHFDCRKVWALQEQEFRRIVSR
jgi:glycosyltransferase involved in cell wall biosynthesis